MKKRLGLMSLRGRHAIVLLGVALGLTFTGCARFDQLRLHTSLKRANKAFEAGDYELAASRYESLIDRYPQSRNREQLRLRQGIALYTIGSYHDARDSFLMYLREYPQGQYREDAHDYIKKINVLNTANNPAQQSALEAAKADLDQLRQLRMKYPNDPAVAYAIGNLLYEMGDYEEAVRNYYEALSIDAAYKEKSLIQQRMMLDDQGKPVPMTPGAIRDLEKDERPLVIFNTQSYTSRDREQVYGGPKQFYNVTGLVRNQGTRMVPDAFVEVRFLNSQHRVLDVKRVRVGAIGPGQVRAFIAVADNYDNLYNIERFEIIPSWQW